VKHGICFLLVLLLPEFTEPFVIISLFLVISFALIQRTWVLLQIWFFYSVTLNLEPAQAGIISLLKRGANMVGAEFLEQTVELVHSFGQRSS